MDDNEAFYGQSNPIALFDSVVLTVRAYFSSPYKSIDIAARLANVYW